MSISFEADVSGLFGTIKINGVSQLVIKSDGSLESPAGKVIGTSEGIVGTVSQAAGVPTGSIIERGSNANGEYVKFADGTMICTMSITVTDQAISNDWSPLYYGLRTWTFPSVFASAPTAACTTFKRGSIATFGGTANPTTESVVLRGYSVVSGAAGESTTIGAMAIGRWF